MANPKLSPRPQIKPEPFKANAATGDRVSDHEIEVGDIVHVGTGTREWQVEELDDGARRTPDFPRVLLAAISADRPSRLASLSMLMLVRKGQGS